jgi:aquaporin Z
MSASGTVSKTAAGVARLAAAEFVGTTIVMIGGPGLLVIGGGDVSRLELALGFGISTAIAIGVIGAVANPMFSLALWFAKAITGRELVSDWIGQLLGAVFGAAVLFGLNDTTRFVTGVNGYDTSGLKDGVDLGYNLSGFSDLGVVLAAELVMAVIVVVVLLGSIREQRSNTATAGFVGGAMVLAALFLSPISGVGINPARSIGMAIFADTDPNALGQVWVFVVVPVVAAFAGLLVWLAIDDDTIDDTVFDDTVLETATDALTGDD